jgi:hypothetical protein
MAHDLEQRVERQNVCAVKNGKTDPAMGERGLFGRCLQEKDNSVGLDRA